MMAVMAFALLLQGRADPEIHLIPTAYAGQVTIAFRAANGEPIVDENGARLYKIPENGILLTQPDPERSKSSIHAVATCKPVVCLATLSLTNTSLAQGRSCLITTSSTITGDSANSWKRISRVGSDMLACR